VVGCTTPESRVMVGTRAKGLERVCELMLVIEFWRLPVVGTLTRLRGDKDGSAALTKVEVTTAIDLAARIMNGLAFLVSEGAVGAGEVGDGVGKLLTGAETTEAVVKSGDSVVLSMFTGATRGETTGLATLFWKGLLAILEVVGGEAKSGMVASLTWSRVKVGASMARTLGAELLMGTTPSNSLGNRCAGTATGAEAEDIATDDT
jgi:hypothetical protein